MRYRFIERERVHYPVRLLCGLLAVSRSSYYVWRGGYESPRTRDNRHLLGLIHAVYRRAKGRYGSPLIHQALREQGVAVGRHRVARLMQQAGLKARRRRRRFRATTQSRHAHPIAPNRLGRNFAANRPNEKWVADITYVPTREGWLYLAVVLDLYARRVVGWAGDGTAYERGPDPSRLAYGAASTTPPGGADAPFGSGPPVCGPGLSWLVAPTSHPSLDEPQRQLLGQCADGEFHRHAENRIDPSP